MSPVPPVWFGSCSLVGPDSLVVVAGARVIRSCRSWRRPSRSEMRPSSRSSRRRAPSSICRSSSKVSVELWFCPLLLEPIMTFCPCLSFRDPDQAGTVSSFLRAGRSRPEPSPRRPTQVRCYRREGHRGHRQAREGDEFSHGRA
jgi:hypothetical protein